MYRRSRYCCVQFTIASKFFWLLTLLEEFHQRPSSTNGSVSFFYVRFADWIFLQIETFWYFTKVFFLIKLKWLCGDIKKVKIRNFILSCWWNINNLVKKCTSFMWLQRGYLCLKYLNIMSLLIPRFVFIMILSNNEKKIAKFRKKIYWHLCNLVFLKYYLETWVEDFVFVNLIKCFVLLPFHCKLQKPTE